MGPFFYLLCLLPVVSGLRATKGQGYTFSAAARDRMVQKHKQTVGRKLAEAKRNQGKDELDDPFNEDFGDDEPKSKEDRDREKYEAALTRQQEKAERSRLFAVVQEAGGLQTRDNLREEYAGIPNTYKRRDGLSGDEMAEYLSTYYPEFGVEDERDLIDFLAS